ncbi:MAG: hypothetical protein GY821_04515 [Gammaproteobacteria bacterium]|nr:hypothetical protein [Gammaproteobacteria bacterium]
MPAKRNKLSENQQATYNDIIKNDPLTLKFYTRLYKRFSANKSNKTISPNEAAKKVYDYMSNPENYYKIEQEMRELIASLKGNDLEVYEKHENKLEGEINQHPSTPRNLVEPGEIKQIQNSISQAIKSNKPIENHNGKKIDEYSKECYGIMFEKDEIARRNLEKHLNKKGISITREKTWLWGSGVRKKTLAATSIIHKFSEKVCKDNIEIKRNLEEKMGKVIASKNPKEFKENASIFKQFKSFLSNLLFGKYKEKIENYAEELTDIIEEGHDDNKIKINADNIEEDKKNKNLKKEIKESLNSVIKQKKQSIDKDII